MKVLILMLFSFGLSAQELDTIQVIMLVSVFQDVKIIYGYEVREVKEHVGVYDPKTMQFMKTKEHVKYLKAINGKPFEIDIRSELNPKGKVIVWQAKQRYE